MKKVILSICLFFAISNISISQCDTDYSEHASAKVFKGLAIYLRPSQP